MEYISFYTFDFQPVFILQDLISVNWQLHFNQVGTFELHTTLQDELTRVLREYPYLVAVQGKKQAIITGYRLSDECVLYGRTCNWLLSKRVTVAFEKKTMPVENLCRDMAAQAFSDVPSFVLGETAGLKNKVSFELKQDVTTLEAICQCLEQEKGGHELCFDPSAGQWIFQILSGRRLPLVVSEDNQNAYETAYIEDFLDYYTCGWYEEEQEADSEGNQPEAVRTYLEGDGGETGIYRWECLLSGTTEEEARRQLQSRLWNQTARAKVRDIQFGRDYQLGDLLTVKVSLGGFQKSQEKRITGVHIWYEADGCGEEPSFEAV